MLWTEVRKWAKEQGYTTLKDKDTNQYYWTMTDAQGVEHSGVAASVSKLARAIYNHITDNKWVDHQNSYSTSPSVISGETQ